MAPLLKAKKSSKETRACRRVQQRRTSGDGRFMTSHPDDFGRPQQPKDQACAKCDSPSTSSTVFTPTWPHPRQGSRLTCSGQLREAQRCQSELVRPLPRRHLAGYLRRNMSSVGGACTRLRGQQKREGEARRKSRGLISTPLCASLRIPIRM